MKTPRRLLLLAVLGASLASAQTATLTGTVSNTATRSFLEGALVSLAGTTETAFTDRDGSFMLTGIAPGAYTLEVTYTGLDRHTQPIVITAGRNVAPAIGLRSDVYRLDAFTVNGEREGSAAAITRQRKDYYRPQKIRYNGMRFNFGVSGNF